ncbi:hypothetical protein HDU82_008569 [Entophlyctis luteolus]|nr:hypothetical protein HDU82_008569 [Entophlyctis luteolus]
MNSAKSIPIYPAFAFEGYPNRDSTPYNERYKIPEAKTVIRGTLRYAGFPKFINALVKLGFLEDQEVAHLAPTAQPTKWRDLLAKSTGVSFTSVDDLEAAVRKVAQLSGDDGDRIIFGMKWLGMFSEKLVHLRGTMLDTLCATLEEKMMYAPGERDMVMLQHRFNVEYPDGRKEIRTSTDGDSAMATTVGVPCGIATQLILDGKLKRRGIIAPMDAEINDPILEALEKEGVFMTDAIIA